MEVVMQMMYSYSLELLAAAVGLMLLLELVTLRKINKWKRKEKEQFFELEEKQNKRKASRDHIRCRLCQIHAVHSEIPHGRKP